MKVGSVPEKIDMTSLQHYASLDKAWQEYKSEGNLTARDFIIVSYTPMVDRIAKKLYRKRPWIFDLGDLRQAGFVGLMEAINKFEPERGYLFSTFAPRRITGSILDEINSMDWTPRSVREKIRAVLSATEQHYTENQHQPTTEEIAEISGLTTEQVALAWDYAKKTYIGHIDTHTVSDFERSDANEINIVTTVEEDHKSDVGVLVEKVDEKNIVLDAINSLCTTQEALVLRLNFYDRRSLKDIGQEIGLSPAKVSALRKSAIAKLMESTDIQGLNVD